ncbi:hypothetical protein ACQQ2Q_06580 [Agrobacterium sp. ES01]|uniref:hypothetical protein n=1 Tax=Agrobacterium sp. ES01 TaxID=3420714 RepID=UPI003D0D7F18
MKGRLFRTVLKRLALGPAVFVLAYGFGASAQTGKDEDVYRKVASEEARVLMALKASDGAALKRSVGALGKLIDSAMARRERGETVTACDMSAHSLAFVAVSTLEGLAHGKQERQLLLGDAKSAAEDFRKDMQACEKLTGHKIGSHASVGKALRAL